MRSAASPLHRPPPHTPWSAASGPSPGLAILARNSFSLDTPEQLPPAFTKHPPLRWLPQAFLPAPPITPTSASSPNSPLCDHFRTSRGLSHLPPTAPNLSVPLLIWQNWNTTQSGSRECCLSWCVCIWGSEELKFQNYFFFF